MKRVLRSFGLLFALVAVLGVFCSTCPMWAQSIGIDVWNLERLYESCDREHQKDQELSRIMHKVAHRLEVKDALMGDLYEGRKSLREVTRMFLELCMEDPVALQNIRDRFPGSTDEEKMYSHVLSYYENYLEVYATDTQEAMTKVLEEYRRLTLHSAE